MFITPVVQLLIPLGQDCVVQIQNFLTGTAFTMCSILFQSASSSSMAGSQLFLSAACLDPCIQNWRSHSNSTCGVVTPPRNNSQWSMNSSLSCTWQQKASNDINRNLNSLSLRPLPSHHKAVSILLILSKTVHHVPSGGAFTIHVCHLDNFLPTIHNKQVS